MLKKILHYLYLQYTGKIKFGLGKGYCSRLIQRTGIVSYPVNGIQIELNPTALLDRYLINNQEINPTLIDIFDKKLKRGDYFLDIGANIGYFSVLAEKKYQANVIACEPSPRELKRFYGNLSLNDCMHTHCLPLAIGNENSVVPFRLTNYQNPSMNHVSDSTDKNCINVQIVKITSILSSELLRKIRVCKIDVEGFEVDCLLGFGDQLSLMTNCNFVVEISPQYVQRHNRSVADIYEIFRNAGFRFHLGIQQSNQWEEIFYV